MKSAAAFGSRITPAGTALALLAGFLLTLGSLLGSATAAQAAPGDLDPTFSGDGRQTTDFQGGSDDGQSMVRQPDGKVVVVGGTTQGSNGRFAVARYNLDGSLDPSFSGDGRQTVDFGAGNDGANGVALQTDGKIVVAGTATSGGRAKFGVVRLNANGSLDNTFSGDGRADTRIGDGWIGTDVALDQDGRIVVAGWAYGPGSFSVYAAVARFRSDGSLDPGFSGDGRQTTDFGSDESYAEGVALTRDGKIVLAGQVSPEGLQGEAYNFGVARLNTDGSLDPTFAGDGRQTTKFPGVENGASDVVLQPDGKILAAGYSEEVSGEEADEYKDFALARYKTNGALDTGFSGDGKQLTDLGGSDRVSGIALAPDGKIVAAGGRFRGLGTFDFALARYNPTGSLDRTFSGDGRVTTDFSGKDDSGAAVLLPPSGKILVAGSATRAGSDFALARYRG